MSVTPRLPPTAKQVEEEAQATPSSSAPSGSTPGATAEHDTHEEARHRAVARRDLPVSGHRCPSRSWHTHENEFCLDDDLSFTGVPDFNGHCTTGHTPLPIPMMHVWVVDNACHHRFAGIGAGGIECGPHGQHPGGTVPHPGGSVPGPRGTLIPHAPDEHPAPPTVPPTTGPPTTGQAPATTRPPAPLKATPRYTG
jgi:hypothetical protein